MPASSRDPLVSIVLPTYNRARFLPQAFASIRAQTWPDWELIIVDDGSRDDTSRVVEELSGGLGNSVRYRWQENGGPATARNSGIEMATGKYLTFFDSDDYWLPHHLKDCVEGMEANPEVGWMFCAGRRMDYETKRVLIEHTMYANAYRPLFLSLRTRQAGKLRIFDDPGVLRCVLRSAGFAGLQSSMVRREVFSRMRFQPAAFFEDRLAFMRAIGLGVQMAYLDDVHVVVYSHNENVSFASDKAIESRVAAMRIYVAALESLGRELRLSGPESRALRARRGEESFWNLGYFLLQRARYGEALQWMRYGLRCCPGNLRFWKTYLATRAKALLAMRKRDYSSPNMRPLRDPTK